MAFAIPSDTVRYVVGQILRYGHVRRPWIGASLQSAGPHGMGLLVVRVSPQGPAATAGLYPGDLLIKINGVTVTRIRDVIRILETVHPGTVLKITVLRGTLKLTLPLKLGEIPSSAALSQGA